MKIFHIFLLNLLLFGLAAYSNAEDRKKCFMPSLETTQGKVKNGTYFSKNNAFSISTPHEDKRVNCIFIETYSNQRVYVSFNLTKNLSKYSIEIRKKTPSKNTITSLDSFTESMVSFYINQLELGYDTKITPIKKEKLTINGAPSYYLELRQPFTPNPKKHQVYISDFPETAVIFWVESSISNVSPEKISALEFAKSFKLNKVTRYKK